MLFGQQPKSGDEHDVTSRWRYLACRYRRPGVTSGIKRQMRRRARRLWKQPRMMAEQRTLMDMLLEDLE